MSLFFSRMSKYPPIDDTDYKWVITNAWKVKYDTKTWFPNQVTEWVNHHSTILGVPETYLSVPLLVSGAYCSQHATVNAGDLHIKPTTLYALVCGRCGE